MKKLNKAKARVLCDFCVFCEKTQQVLGKNVKNVESKKVSVFLVHEML